MESVARQRKPDGDCTNFFKSTINTVDNARMDLGPGASYGHAMRVWDMVLELQFFRDAGKAKLQVLERHNSVEHEVFPQTGVRGQGATSWETEAPDRVRWKNNQSGTMFHGL